MIYLLLRFCLSFAFNSLRSDDGEKMNRGNVIYRDIDWHDYAYLLREAKQMGLGEHGEAVETLDSEADKVAKALATYGYNAYLSDRIALNRSVADIRPSE